MITLVLHLLRRRATPPWCGPSRATTGRSQASRRRSSAPSSRCPTRPATAPGLWKAEIACLHYGLAGGFLEVGPGGSYVLISEMVVAAKVPALTAPAVCGVAA